MATKLARRVTYLDGLLLIKSNEHIITLFCEIIWKTKNTCPLPPYFMVTKRSRIVTYLE